MKRIYLLIFILILAACGPIGGNEPVEESAKGPEPGVSATAKPEKDEPAAAASPDDSNSSTSSTIESTSEDAPTINVAQTPAEASHYRKGDHTKGADDPLITIVEYGDFQ